MQTGKKLCAILLVLCMLVGVLPASVLAAGTDTQVIGQQLLLGDDLCMHLYTTVSEELTNPVATVSVAGNVVHTYAIKEMTAREDGSYDLSVHLGAPQMADAINLVIVDGESEVLNKTYSVRDYAHYLIENNYTDETKALAKNLLHYGAKAQQYFGYNANDLANSSYPIEPENTIAAEAPALTVSGAVEGIRYYGSSMVFRSKIAMRYYFQADSIDGYTFTVDGEELEPQKKDNKFYIEVADINPQNMGKEMTVAVTDGTDTLEFTYSPDAYISRMYHKDSTQQTMKELLVAANCYFEAAEIFTGVKENRTGALHFLQYSYGTSTLIQVKTDLPSDTPIANFTTGQNGCSIDQSANLYQQVGWIGMAQDDTGAIYLAFNFNAAFEAGQTYTLPKGAVFGFTDNSKYTLDKNYTFTFDGSGWTMVAAEPAITMEYRWGNEKLIQYNTNLPVEAMGANFLADDNGCALIQNGNQQVGYISMADAEGTVVLTFNFNAAFEVGGSYTLAAGSVFGFENGSKYQLNEDITLYWDGSNWGAEPPATEPPTTEPPATEPELESLSFTYRYGTNNLIQVNTNLPASTPCVNFTADQNGCSIDQSANTVQWFGWAGMENVDGVIVITFHFNAAFAAGQTYFLPAGAIFGFTDGSKYALDSDYTFTFDGASWSMEGGAEVEPPVTEPTLDPISFQYRYGTNNLIQVNTNLPASTPIQNFLTGDNGCVIDESANQYQNVAWIGMANAEGTIVLTFNFGSAFEAGQTYTLPAGAIFGFTDGNKYALDDTYTFTFDGASWSMEGGAEVEPPVTEPEEKNINLTYRWGAADKIQFNTDLPSDTPCANFLATDNGCNLTQNVQAGWIGMEAVDGVIVLTFHFNSAFAYGENYNLAAGSVFGFTDGSSYTMPSDVNLYWDGAAWTTEEPAKQINLTYRWGNANTIQYNTDLPATTPCASFTAGDNGCNLIQTENVYQNVGWIGMENVDGVIVLTFHFNSDFTYGQNYTLSAGSVFGFTDGSSYTLPGDVNLYWDGSNWTTEEPAKQINLTYRWGNANTIQYNTDLPATTPCASFTAGDNGCNLIQTENVYQNVGWIGMENVDGVIVLTFHFNSAYTFGQNYILSAGSVFGFTDGNSYTMPGDVNLYWDGTGWTDQEPAKEINLTYRWGNASLIQYNTDLPATTPCASFTAGDNGCNLIQTENVYQNVGWIGMEAVDGVIVLTFHFNTAYTFGQNYILSAGSVFGFTDGNSYVLNKTSNLYWDDAAWGETVPEVKDVLDAENFTGGKEFISFADLPVDGNNAQKLAEYVALGFNTSLLTEDHTGAQGPDERYSVSMQTANAPSDSLSFLYRYGTNNLIQVNTNLPSDTPCANFTVSDNDCYIDQSGNTVQWVGWIGMDNVDGVIVLTFHFNNAFQAGQSYVLPKDALFGFTDGNMYLLDGDYTFTFDGANWSMSSSTLQMALSAGAAKYMQLKTNIPTGLTYGDFLLGEAAKKGHNVILETTDGAQAVGWFSYSELSGAVYLTFNFNGFNKPGTQYILKAGTSLKAGDNVYTTDRDYILTVNNDYLTSLEKLDEAGLDVWIRNYHNKADYFSADMTNALLLYKDVIDGFYMVDEAFQTNALLTAAGQEDKSSDFDSMTVVRDWFNTNFAEKYYHSNHVPITSYDHYTAANGSTLSAMDVDGYKAFLQAYKAAYNDQLTGASGASVSFDNYPFIHAQGTYEYGTLNLLSKFESGIQSTYLLNCLVAAQVAAGDDFGMCIQTFEASDLTYEVKRDIVSAAEVSLQLYTGMAMGADLFEYFAYNSNGEFSAIMNTDGSKRIYDIVAEGNQALCFSDVVNTFSWNGIMTSAGSVNSHNSVGFGYVSGMVLSDSDNGVLSSVASTDDAIVGCFTKDALNGYMVVNFNDPAAVTGNNTVNLTFAGCTRARVYTEVNGVLTSQVVELTNGACSVELAPGSACFVIPA